MEDTIRIQYYHSPCGELILGSYGDKLCLCDWLGEERRKLIDGRIQKGLKAGYVAGDSPVLRKAAIQLDEYFDRKRNVFDIPLLFVGTDFQKSVWNALLDIPYGTTVSYAALSQRLGNPQAARAVASANRANAISIFVPCHRVIGSNRQLTGYAGGLPAKQLLLELESFQ